MFSTAPGKAPRISRFHVLTTRDNATKVLCPGLVRVPATHVPSSVHRRNACQELWRGFWDSGRGMALTFLFESGVKPGFLEFLSVLLTGNILFSKTPASLAPPSSSSSSHGDSHKPGQRPRVRGPGNRTGSGTQSSSDIQGT